MAAQEHESLHVIFQMLSVINMTHNPIRAFSHMLLTLIGKAISEMTAVKMKMKMKMKALSRFREKDLRNDYSDLIRLKKQEGREAESEVLYVSLKSKEASITTTAPPVLQSNFQTNRDNRTSLEDTGRTG